MGLGGDDDKLENGGGSSGGFFESFKVREGGGSLPPPGVPVMPLLKAGGGEICLCFGVPPGAAMFRGGGFVLEPWALISLLFLSWPESFGEPLWPRRAGVGRWSRLRAWELGVACCGWGLC